MPGIGYRDHRIAPGLNKTVFAQVRAHRDAAALHRQLATLRHGILRIHDQVHDDLFELPGVGAGVSGVGGEARDQFDVFADQGPQQPLHVADHAVDVDDLQFQELLAAERQQLPGQGRGAVGGLLDRLHLVVHVAAFFQLLQQHLGVSGDHHQQVVEVVRDAAGQPAHRIHLLRLPQLLFQLPPVGDVFRHQFQHFFGFIAGRGGAAA